MHSAGRHTEGGRRERDVGMGKSHQGIEQGAVKHVVVIQTSRGCSRTGVWCVTFGIVAARLTCSDRLEQDPVKSSMSDLEPPSRSSRMRSVGILPFRQVMYRLQKLSHRSCTFGNRFTFVSVYTTSCSVTKGVTAVL